jgi:hypothetical protein
LYDRTQASYITYECTHAQDEDEPRQDAIAENDMRGWLTTVAIGISFEPMNQRPYWMPEPNNHDYSLWRNPHLTSAASWGFYYVCLNTVTFSMSVAGMKLLLHDSDNFFKISDKLLFIIKSTQQHNKADHSGLLSAGFAPKLW